jgi:hypothetical protein
VRHSRDGSPDIGFIVGSASLDSSSGGSESLSESAAADLAGPLRDWRTI